jgi:hypothetical protein
LANKKNNYNVIGVMSGTSLEISEIEKINSNLLNELIALDFHQQTFPNSFF